MSESDPAVREVFLSHATEDHDAAMRICRALEKAGLRCWIAPRDIPPSHAWAGAIVEAVRQCRVSVVILSEHSLASRQVVREVELSDTSHRPLLAVRIDAAKLSGELAYFLLNTQWYDAASQPLEQVLPGVAAAVRELLSPDALEAVEPAWSA